MKYLKLIALTALLLFTITTIHANSQPYCDSLIKRGIDAMMSKNFGPAINLLSEAQKTSAENHWQKQLFLATNNIGLTYYFMLDYGEALHHFLNAYNIAMAEKDAALEMTVLNNIAILYSKENNYDKAREYFLKAYAIAKEKNDKVRLGYYASNLGIMHNEMHQLAKAREYLREATTLLQNDTHRLLGAQYAYAQNQLQEGNIAEAIQLGNKLLITARDSGYRDEYISLCIMMASAELRQNNIDRALAYADEALAGKPNLEEKIEIYQTLSDIHLKDHNYTLALASKDSVVLYRDAINTVRNSQQFENGKLKFELLNSTHTLSLNQAQLTSQRRLLYMALVFIAVIVAFFIWLMRIKAVESKQKAVIAERSHKIMALEVENEKSQKLLLEEQLKERETAALLEQERLKNEIEIRNRKLSAKALYLSGRNELIDEIITALSRIPDLSKDSIKNISQLKSYLRTDEEWDDFSTHFQEVNQGFLNALRQNHPNLTSNDVRFLSYIYMNLNTKEIASLLNITPEGCRKRKERITKKMQLTENTSLFEYLSGL